MINKTGLEIKWEKTRTRHLREKGAVEKRANYVEKDLHYRVFFLAFLPTLT